MEYTTDGSSIREKRSPKGKCPDGSVPVDMNADGLTCYIAAQIDSKHMKHGGYLFSLGDGNLYNGYTNSPVKEGWKYGVIIGVGATADVSLSSYGMFSKFS